MTIRPDAAQPEARLAIDPADRGPCKRIPVPRCPDAGNALGAIGWVRMVLQLWRHHHVARCELLRCARLDRRFASDIGLTLGDIVMAARTPVWVSMRHAHRFGGSP